MKSFLLPILTLFVFACANSRADDLSELIDAAAASGEKKIVLENRTYFIDSPILLDVKHNGLCLEGASGGGTVISCGKRIEGWEKSGGLWRARVEGESFISSLYVNGVRASTARTPNNDFFFAAYKVPEIGSSGGSRTAFVADNKDIEPLLKMSVEELANVRILVYPAWIQHTLAIEKLEPYAKEPGCTIIHFKKPGASSPLFRWANALRFRILNYAGAIDRGGEFFFDKSSSTVWYKPRKGENMKTAKVFYPLFDTALYGAGESVNSRIRDISIKNITFEYGSYRPDVESSRYSGGVPAFGVADIMKSPDADSWKNSSQGATCAPAFLRFEFAENINISGCKIRHTDGYALELGKSVWNSSVKECEIFDTGAGGVRLGVPIVAKPSDNPKLDGLTSGGLIVSDNIICKYGRWHKSGVGVMAFDVADTQIVNNDIFDGYYSGISVGWVWGGGPTHTKNNKINYNRIHDLSYAFMNDLGGIYTLGTSPNSEIIGNVIYGINCHRYGGWGIYNDEGSRGFLISKNYVSDAQEGGYFMHYGSECKVENNLLCNSSDFQIGLGRQGKNSFSFERNIVLYSSPAILFRLNTPPNPDSVRFDKNIYFNRGGEVVFGGMTFAQWQASGRDKNSFVEPVDIGAILGGAAVEKIGFEPINPSAAGVRGGMKKRLAEILENYNFPKVRRTPIESSRPITVMDNFEYDRLGKPPFADVTARGDKFEVIEDPQTKRAMRVTDLPAEPAWMPYFFYNCKASKKSLGIVEFKMKLSKNSTFYVDVRKGEGNSGKGPNFAIIKASFEGAALPVGKWLTARMEIPVLDSDSKGIYSLSISDGAAELVRQARNTPQPDFDDFNWVGIVMTGNEGAVTDFADIKIYFNEVSDN